jgi:hypothetical protein
MNRILTNPMHSTDRSTQDDAAPIKPTPETPQPSRPLTRRSFVQRLGLASALVPAVGIGGGPSRVVIGGAASRVVAQSGKGHHGTGRLNRGDTAILRLLAAAELIEADLWQQYNELGGVNAASTGYTSGLLILDGDMSQYISDNTDDEISHAAFLNAYLASKGEAMVSLEPFRSLPSSQASGARQVKRLTNLTQLSVDTSWWTRYRSATNPDFGARFPDAVPSLRTGRHTAIPRNNAELGDPNNPNDHVKAIAFTAGFHFGYIEQGGISLYATLAQKVTSPEVLRILISIGGSEIMHFQTWQDKAGNATPLTDFDPVNNSTVTFEDLTTNQPETLQANLIMPEPCEFISPNLPHCAVIRPTGPGQLDARGVINSFIADGLFIGQSSQFFQFINSLAQAADAADRE